MLEVLKGEKEISVIARENEIAPNQIRNWKNEFISNASNVFDNKKGEKIREALKSNESEKDQLCKKVGQLTTQVDWLKKKIRRITWT